MARCRSSGARRGGRALDQVVRPAQQHVAVLGLDARAGRRSRSSAAAPRRRARSRRRRARRRARSGPCRLAGCAARGPRTRRGVKPLLTRLRRCLCSGSSMLIIDGIGGESGREPWREQKVGGSRESAITSSYRVTPHTPLSRPSRQARARASSGSAGADRRRRTGRRAGGSPGCAGERARAGRSGAGSAGADGLVAATAKVVTREPARFFDGHRHDGGGSSPAARVSTIATGPDGRGMTSRRAAHVLRFPRRALEAPANIDSMRRGLWGRTCT